MSILEDLFGLLILGAATKARLTAEAQPKAPGSGAPTAAARPMRQIPGFTHPIPTEVAAIDAPGRVMEDICNQQLINPNAVLKAVWEESV